jgi:hypothetical protein
MTEHLKLETEEAICFFIKLLAGPPVETHDTLRRD